MPVSCPRGHHVCMPQSLAVTRLTLIANARSDRTSPPSAKVRRYRLASMPADGRPAAERFAYLKRSHD
jgi:hypothetical protein